MGIAEDLHLDMARPLQESLEHQPSVAEGILGLAARAANRFVERRCFVHDAHALAAAARDRLHEQRIPDALRFRSEPRGRLFLAHVTGHDRNARGRHERLCLVLETHRADGRGRRADECECRRVRRIAANAAFSDRNP